MKKNFTFMTKQGWMFAVPFFLFSVYYTMSKAHFAHWKSIRVMFHLIDFTHLISAIGYAAVVFAFYLLCALIPSRRIIAVPSIITIMLAAQQLTLAYFTFPIGDVIGGLVLLIATVVIAGMALIYAKIALAVIDGIGASSKGNYLTAWLREIKLAVVANWKFLVIDVLIYVVINASIVMTLTFK